MDNRDLLLTCSCLDSEILRRLVRLAGHKNGVEQSVELRGGDEVEL